MMQPQLAEKIAKRTRKAFSEGISAHGTDALRFTLFSLASTGRDINWDMKRLEGYRNFCNKIWNAARYVLMNTEDQNCGQNDEAFELSLADKWIISRLQQTEAAIEKQVADFRLDLASQTLYDFIWNEYCDWYLELSKPILTSDQSRDALKLGTRRTLVRVLEAFLRLAHPFIPFITEEIWQRVAPLAGKSGDTIMNQAYPVQDVSKINALALGDVEWLKGVILAIRNIRGEMDISPAKAIPVFLRAGNTEDKRRFEENAGFISSLAKLESMQWLDKEEAPMSATQLVGGMEVLVPMAGLINVEAEVARLNKELDKAAKEIGRLEGKLNNEKFVSHAPDDVVEKEKAKLNEAQSQQAKLKEQLAKISEM
jgi:valyl-tRNA synthetase